MSGMDLLRVMSEIDPGYVEEARTEAKAEEKNRARRLGRLPYLAVSAASLICACAIGWGVWNLEVNRHGAGMTSVEGTASMEGMAAGNPVPYSSVEDSNGKADAGKAPNDSVEESALDVDKEAVRVEAASASLIEYSTGLEDVLAGNGLEVSGSQAIIYHVKFIAEGDSDMGRLYECLTEEGYDVSYREGVLYGDLTKEQLGTIRKGDIAEKLDESYMIALAEE